MYFGSLLLVIRECTLVVYYSPRQAYQFLIIDESGEAIDFSEMFYTQEAAVGKGKSVVKTLSR